MAAMSISTSDPWEWSVDAVVAHFCGVEGFLFPRFECLVDRIELENSIRSNHLAGEFLLQLDHTEVGTYLGISAAGPLICCRNQIGQLQRQSHKWLFHVSQYSTTQQHQYSKHLSDQAAQANPRLEFTASTTTTIENESPLPIDTSQTVRPAGPKRIAPLLLLDQAHRESSGQPARECSHVGQELDTKILSALSPYSTTLPLASTRTKGYISDWKELYDSARPPPIPEVSFFQQEPPTVVEETSGSKAPKESSQALTKQSKIDLPASHTDNAQRLDNLIVSQLDHWKATKLPKLELKAHQLWKDAWDKVLMQGHCRQKIEQLTERLLKLKREVLISASSRDIDRLGDALEPTVTDIAAWEWKLNLYHQTRQPEKPPPESKQKIVQKLNPPRPEHIDGDIDLSSEDSDEPNRGRNEYYGTDDSDLDDEEDNGDNVVQGVPPAQPDPKMEDRLSDVRADIVAYGKRMEHETDGQTMHNRHVGDNHRAYPEFWDPNHVNASTNQETVLLDDSQIPPYWDLVSWSRLDTTWPEILIKYRKVEHLLAWNIAHNLSGWTRISSWLRAQNHYDSPWTNIRHALHFMLQPNRAESQIFKTISGSEFESLLQLAIWYTSWHCTKPISTSGIPKEHVVSAMSSTKTNIGRASFARFWGTIHHINARWNNKVT